MTTFEDQLNTGAGNAWKWAEVGDKIAGTVISKAIVNRPNFDGVPEDVPVIGVRDDEGTEWDLWLGKSSLRSAVGRALQKVAPGTILELGGKLAIQREPDGQATKVGYSAPHQYVAAYQPPTATAAPTPTADAPAPSASDLFG